MTPGPAVRSRALRALPTRANVVADLVAAFTFAIVNVPQAMGHALLAAVNPVLGIYTLMVAVPIGALFSSSVFMNVSTTGALSVAAGVVLVKFPPGERAEALIVLVLLVGIIQLLAGVFRLGFLVRFVSNAVMTGFLNGVAVLIILGQLADLTGYASSFANPIGRALDTLLRLPQAQPQVTLIGVTTLALIAGLLWFAPVKRFAFIIAIAVATLLLAALAAAPGGAGFATVPTVGSISLIPRELPELVLPELSLVATLLLPALSIAIVGLVQGAGVSQGIPNPDGRYPNVSRDFIGQGAANIATSAVGGIPAGGSVSGTVLLMSAGARSRWANLFVGLCVAVIVLLAAPLVERVPMPALAALLIVAGIQGLRIAQARIIWNTGRISRVVMLVTFFATLMIPLQFAVLFGVALSILLNTIRQSNRVVVKQWVLQAQGFPLERPAPERLASRQLTVLHIYGSLFFAAARSIEDVLPRVGDARQAMVALNLRGESEIGSTFVAVLERYARALQAGGGQLMLVGVDAALREQLAKTGMLQTIGEDNVFMATEQLGEALNRAIAVAQSRLADGVTTAEGSAARGEGA